VVASTVGRVVFLLGVSASFTDSATLVCRGVAGAGVYIVGE